MSDDLRKDLRKDRRRQGSALGSLRNSVATLAELFRDAAPRQAYEHNQINNANMSEDINKYI